MVADSGSKPVTPLVTVELGDDGGTTEFFSVAEIEDWIKQERKQWEFAANSELNENHVDVFHPFVQLADEFANLRRTLDSERKSGGEIDLAIAKCFSQRMAEIYVKNKTLVHSKSVFGEFILDMKKEHEAQAACVWWLWIRPNQVTSNPSKMFRSYVFSAAFKAVAFESGFGPNKPESKAFESLRAEWRVILADEHRAFHKQLEQSEQLTADLAAKIEAMSVQSAIFQKTHDVLCSSHTEEMSSIRTKYRDELAVRSAVKYWRARAKTHSQLSRSWGKWSLGYAAAAFFGLPMVQYILSGFPNYIEKAIESGNLEASAISAMMTQSMIASAIRFVVLAMIAVWPLRIFVRNYLSHTHLEADAREREIIVRTYLALLNDPDLQGKEGLKEQILPHALESIFRHTADGIVKDDAMPWQSIIDAVKGKGGAT